jgi:hypothetical protein
MVVITITIITITITITITNITILMFIPDRSREQACTKMCPACM